MQTRVAGRVCHVSASRMLPESPFLSNRHIIMALYSHDQNMDGPLGRAMGNGNDIP